MFGRKRLAATLTLALAACSFAFAAPPRLQSLYERMGGHPTLEAIARDLIARVLADPRVSRKFARTLLPRFETRLVEQLCHVTGGPCRDLPRSMEAAHHRMNVTDGEFDAVVEDLTAALRKYRVPATEALELLARLAPLRKQIVEVKSPETGTPLPPYFEAAGPLGYPERITPEKR